MALGRKSIIDQEFIVAIAAAVFFVGFALSLDRFLTYENIINLVRNVSVLGMLSLGMAVVVIGRGVDLSIAAVMAVSMTISVILAKNGLSFPVALLIGLIFAILCGAVTGWLIAYVEISAIFATIAMLSIIYGFGAGFVADMMVNPIPKDLDWFVFLGMGSLLSVPVTIWVFAAMCLVIHLILSKTQLGRYFYAIGDNLSAARITGISVRPILLSQYVIAAVMAFIAGMVTTASVGSINIRLSNSYLIYDILLVVVLGGIGLSGGKGGVRNVIVGAILIGILLNGMTIMNVNYTVQNLLKSTVLLAALIVDALLNPRDEQTSQQGDI